MVFILALFLSASPAHAQTDTYYCNQAANEVRYFSGPARSYYETEATKAPEGSYADVWELRRLIFLEIANVSVAAAPNTLARVQAALKAWRPGHDSAVRDSKWFNILHCLEYLESNLIPNAAAWQALSQGQVNALGATLAVERKAERAH